MVWGVGGILDVHHSGTPGTSTLEHRRDELQELKVDICQAVATWFDRLTQQFPFLSSVTSSQGSNSSSSSHKNVRNRSASTGSHSDDNTFFRTSSGSLIPRNNFCSPFCVEEETSSLSTTSNEEQRQQHQLHHEQVLHHRNVESQERLENSGHVIEQAARGHNSYDNNYSEDIHRAHKDDHVINSIILNEDDQVPCYYERKYSGRCNREQHLDSVLSDLIHNEKVQKMILYSNEISPTATSLQ